MNKIFKIVFNAARGKMMVVNEATSSVQTGKKAAVTVAVIGALAAGSAMAVEVDADASKTYENLALSHNGGALSNSDAENPKVLDGYTFTNNTANYAGTQSGRGGAVFSQVDLTVSNSVFTGNQALQNPKKDSAKGGAINQNNSAKLVVTDSTFTGNHSGKYGGAISAISSEVEIVGSKFVENTSDSNGSVLYIQGGNTTLTGNSFVDNEAGGRAAALFTEGAKATFKGENTFSGNSAGSGGGALNTHQSGAEVTFAADSVTTFENNSAVKVGGAIRNDDKITFEEGSTAIFIGNQADKGGAIINNDDDGTSPILNLAGTVVFEDNKASQGGAIFNTAKGQVTVAGSSSFVGNQANSYGGAVYNDGGVMSFENSEFSANKVVTSGGDTHGGAINTVGGKVTIANSTFEGNSAYCYNADDSINYKNGHGGAIYARGNAELTVSDSTFTGNKTGKLGGAIYVSQSKLVSTANTYEGNEANAAGVMYLNGAENATFTNDTFTGNKALTGEAGVMSFENSTATFKDSVFSDNTAAGKGGALMVHTASSITLDGTNTFSGNTASGVANDIHNNGNITLGEDSVTNLAGGISGDGTGTLAGTGSVVITDAGATISGQKEIAETLNFSATGSVNDEVGGDIEELSKNVGVTITSMEEGSVMGAVTIGADGSVQQQVNAKTEALADKVTLVPQMIQRIMMNDLRKRMGDIRAGEGTHGAWARYNGGEMSGQGIDNDFHMVQVGIDTVPEVGAPRFGVAFSYAQSEAEDSYGTTDMDSYSLAVYGTKMYDNGMFVDVIGRMATMDTDMVNAGMKAKMDNVALSLSGEFGWRFDVTDSFFIEPSVEATYTYTNADKFTMGNGTYELEATDSLVGRAGFAAGFKCPKNFGDVYVRAAVVHEFMGDTTMNSWVGNRQAAPVEADGEDTYFEYAIGAQFNVNKNTYVYADIERTEGAALDEDWRANVGVRFAF